MADEIVVQRWSNIQVVFPDNFPVENHRGTTSPLIPLNTVLRDGDDPVRMSDNQILERVALHYDFAVENFNRMKVTRPETGLITISVPFSYGEVSEENRELDMRSIDTFLQFFSEETLISMMKDLVKNGSESDPLFEDIRLILIGFAGSYHGQHVVNQLASIHNTVVK